MARTISDEEHQLKRRARRRLIGAIVLVTAFVVVLPMVLDSEPRPPRQEVSVQIPSPDSGVFTSRVVPLPAAPDSRAASKAPVAKPAAGQFVVQVIALADAAKAKSMQQRIAAAGIKSYTEVVKTAKGDVTRVRAGPFATRAAAEKARGQLKALGMNGNITTR